MTKYFPWNSIADLKILQSKIRSILQPVSRRLYIICTGNKHTGIFRIRFSFFPHIIFLPLLHFCTIIKGPGKIIAQIAIPFAHPLEEQFNVKVLIFSCQIKAICISRYCITNHDIIFRCNLTVASIRYTIAIRINCRLIFVFNISSLQISELCYRIRPGIIERSKQTIRLQSPNRVYGISRTIGIQVIKVVHDAFHILDFILHVRKIG